MRHITLACCTVLLISAGCATAHKDPLRSEVGSPSTNPALNAISPARKKAGNALFDEQRRSGADPNETENASKTATATVPEPAEESAAYPEETNTSGKYRLQYYIDAWNKQEEAKEKKPSNTEKLKRLPVIGEPN